MQTKEEYIKEIRQQAKRNIASQTKLKYIDPVTSILSKQERIKLAKLIAMS